MVLNRIAAGRQFHCSAGHFFLVLANFQTFYPILEQRIIDKKKVLSSLIVCNAMKNIGYCIKLHLPFIVLMISATLSLLESSNHGSHIFTKASCTNNHRPQLAGSPLLHHRHYHYHRDHHRYEFSYS